MERRGSTMKLTPASRDLSEGLTDSVFYYISYLIELWIILLFKHVEYTFMWCKRNLFYIWYEQKEVTSTPSEMFPLSTGLENNAAHLLVLIDIYYLCMKIHNLCKGWSGELGREFLLCWGQGNECIGVKRRTNAKERKA